MDYTNLPYEQRKQLQHPIVVEVIQELLKVSHKNIPLNSRICRLDVVLDVPGKKRSLILDFSPLHNSYITSESKIILKLNEN